MHGKTDIFKCFITGMYKQATTSPYLAFFLEYESIIYKHIACFVRTPFLCVCMFDILLNL